MFASCAGQSILSPGQGLRTRAKRTTGKQGLRVADVESEGPSRAAGGGLVDRLPVRGAFVAFLCVCTSVPALSWGQYRRYTPRPEAPVTCHRRRVTAWPSAPGLLRSRWRLLRWSLGEEGGSAYCATNPGALPELAATASVPGGNFFWADANLQGVMVFAGDVRLTTAAISGTSLLCSLACEWRRGSS
jgi:hypothetical protein